MRKVLAVALAAAMAAASAPAEEARSVTTRSGAVLPVAEAGARGWVFGPGLAELRPAVRPEPVVAEAAGPDRRRPEPRSTFVPRARWERRHRGDLWTRTTLAAVESHGRPLIETVPEDIDDWCPAYPKQTPEMRAAFWTGLVSTLARYESTFRPQAVGGGGLWYGLTQILPTTAELRNCRVTTGEALQHGPSNLSCAVRIMANTVPRDGAISIRGERRWQGVAADWGPMTTTWMRRDMQRYTSRQTYCRELSDVRPRPRPVEVASPRSTPPS